MGVDNFVSMILDFISFTFYMRLLILLISSNYKGLNKHSRHECAIITR